MECPANFSLSLTLFGLNSSEKQVIDKLKFVGHSKRRRRFALPAHSKFQAVNSLQGLPIFTFYSWHESGTRD